MDKEINFSIENDALIRHEITPQEEDTYSVKNSIILTKPVFEEMMKRWGREVIDEIMA